MNTKPIQYAVIKGSFEKIDLKEGIFAFQNNSRHYSLAFNVNGETFTANINIRSSDGKDLKIYSTTNPENDLRNLSAFEKMKLKETGVYQNPDSNISIDYLKGNYFDLDKLVIPSDPQKSEWEIIFNLVNDHIKLAQTNHDQVIFWGSYYDDNGKKGIHDIHMNQGYKNGDPNYTWKDGAFIICDSQKIKFACFFVFSIQCLKTDDKGNCI